MVSNAVRRRHTNRKLDSISTNVSTIRHAVIRGAVWDSGLKTYNFISGRDYILQWTFSRSFDYIRISLMNADEEIYTTGDVLKSNDTGKWAIKNLAIPVDGYRIKIGNATSNGALTLTITEIIHSN